MSEKVKTPMGVMTVLRVKELEAQMVYREKKYIRQTDGSYECPTCGSTIQSISVSHPIWDGPFAMSGSGRVFNESSPYSVRDVKNLPQIEAVRLLLRGVIIILEVE